MDTNKILSADLLDILFDNRNKAYGAYELRKTYSQRITKSLVFTGIFTSLIFAGVALANKLKPLEKPKFLIKEGVTLTTITPEEPKPEPIPEPPRQIEQPQTRTEQLTQIRVVPNEEVQTPPPTQDDLALAKIDVVKREGTIDDNIVTPQTLDEGKNILDIKTPKESDIFTTVEIDAKFDGNWIKFLERNLNAQVPIDNNAPPGKYTVILQFVVDVDGTISDIKALNNPGYGLDEEAIRVIKKSKKWEPAIQNGRQVKAYRKQPITFLVTEE